jgi:hypothetical protein
MYQKTRFPDIIRRTDGVEFPTVAGSTEYRSYLAWVAAGNTPTPYIAPPAPVPQSVTMRQARLALLGAGALSGVDAFINSLPSPQKEAARIEWEYASTVERGSALVTALSTALSLDAAALDALFIGAGAL